MWKSQIDPVPNTKAWAFHIDLSLPQDHMFGFSITWEQVSMFPTNFWRIYIGHDSLKSCDFSRWTINIHKPCCFLCIRCILSFHMFLQLRRDLWGCVRLGLARVRQPPDWRRRGEMYLCGMPSCSAAGMVYLSSKLRICYWKWLLVTVSIFWVCWFTMVYLLIKLV